MSNIMARDHFFQLKDLVKKRPTSGDNVVLYDMTVLICVKCKVPLQSIEHRSSYYCPSCKKWRNAQQREYMSIKSFVEFRRVGI